MKYLFKTIGNDNAIRKSKFCIFLLFALNISLLTAQGKYDFIGNQQPMRIGAYYYPEQWPESQWERDMKKMADLGFEFTHFAEFAWGLLEPEEGVYDFGWLDRAIDIAGNNGLKVIMCTQPCTPPAWLANKHPEILLMTEHYNQREHGTRANMSIANDLFREYTEKITREVAIRYGNNPHVTGWQLENEPYGHKDYSPASQEKYRQWLRNKYQSIDNLNAAWGTAFWSQHYNNFEQIRIPTLHFTGWGINPHQMQDYNRYNADIVADFLDFQARILKEHIADFQWITTNYISHIEGADARRTKELDFSSYTCYLVYGDANIGDLGFRIGWPQGIDFGVAFHKPIGGVTGIMELQPGQVNWAQINPQVLPGAIRMWLWNAWGAGNNYVCTYRFRQPLSGSEQFHHGIMRPDGVTLSVGGKEYVQFIEEFNKIANAQPGSAAEPQWRNRIRTAIHWTHDNRWDLNGHKQTSKWNSMDHMFKYFDIVRSTGAPFEFVDHNTDLSAFQYLIIPAHQMVNQELVANWEEFARNGGTIIMSPRTGMKDMNGHLWEDVWAKPVSDLIGAEIDFYDVLPENVSGKIMYKKARHNWEIWADVMIPGQGTEVLATYDDQYYKGKAAVVSRNVGKGKVIYIGVDTQKGDLEKMIVRDIYKTSGAPIKDLAEGVYYHFRDGVHVAVNYSSTTAKLDIPSTAKLLLGTRNLPPAGVTVWRE
jgi:beta-galactosidase